MASVVLDFAGGRRDGPRRKAKLRPRRRRQGPGTPVTGVFFARQVAEGLCSGLAMVLTTMTATPGYRDL